MHRGNDPVLSPTIELQSIVQVPKQALLRLKKNMEAEQTGGYRVSTARLPLSIAKYAATSPKNPVTALMSPASPFTISSNLSVCFHDCPVEAAIPPN